MATFPGVLGRLGPAAHLGLTTPNINAIGFTQDADRAYRWINLAPDSYAFTPVRNVVHFNRVGALFENYIRYIYNRINIYPRLMDLGSVVSAQSENVYVWNAYMEPVTLEDLDSPEGQGLSLTGQQVPPLEFLALQEREWLVSVAAEGAPVIDVQVTWSFDTGETVGIRITGNRISLWPFRPNWANGVLERLEWLTSVQTSPTGHEQRRCNRLSPRRSFQVQTIARDSERALAENMMAGWGGRAWAIPVWPDVQELQTDSEAGTVFIPCRTVGFDFRDGGLVVIRGETAFENEVAQIETVQSNGLALRRALQRAWPRGTYVYPGRSAFFTEQPTMRRITDRAYNIDVKFSVSEPCDWPAAHGMPMYRGKPLLTRRPEESEDLTSTYKRLQQMIDSLTDLPARIDTAGIPFCATAHRWVPVGRAQQTAMRSFFYWLAGRWKSMWVPTFSDDIRIIRDIEFTHTTITIANVGYTQFVLGKPGRRDLFVQLRNSNYVIFRIVDSFVDGDGNEVLTLSTTWNNPTLPVSDILRVSYLVLSRLDQDFIEIRHDTDSDGQASVKTAWIGVRDD